MHHNDEQRSQGPHENPGRLAYWAGIEFGRATVSAALSTRANMVPGGSN